MDNRLICLILAIQFTIISSSSSSTIFDENKLELGKIIKNSAKYLLKNHGHQLKQSGRATTTSQVMITNYSFIFLDTGEISHHM